MGFLKSANFLKVILNLRTLGSHMEENGRPPSCIKEKKKLGQGNSKMAQWLVLAIRAYGLREEQPQEVVFSSLWTQIPTFTNSK